MRPKESTPSRKNGVGLLPEYCHPLSLQGMSPDQFMITVNKILSGRLKLIIDRAREIEQAS
jgi:hypothetical protein